MACCRVASIAASIAASSWTSARRANSRQHGVDPDTPHGFFNTLGEFLLAGWQKTCRRRFAGEIQPPWLRGLPCLQVFMMASICRC